MEWTTKRSRVFPVYTPVTFVHRASPLGYTYTLARITFFFAVGSSCDTCKVFPPHCVSQNWPATCGGRVNREQERPLECAVTLGHVCEIARLLLAENAIQCGACRNGGGSKGRVLPENCGAPNRFLPPVNRKQSCRATRTILLSRAKQSTVSARPHAFFKLEKTRENSSLIVIADVADRVNREIAIRYSLNSQLGIPGSFLPLVNVAPLRATLFRQIEAFTDAQSQPPRAPPLERLGVIVKPIGRSNLIAINLRAFRNTWTRRSRDRGMALTSVFLFRPLH